MKREALAILCAMIDGPKGKRWTWGELAAASGLSLVRTLVGVAELRRYNAAAERAAAAKRVEVLN